ncbi:MULTISPECIES: BMP family lipoprotein [unclassified Candidatus Frackibacter]|uniref:BMP family lipoprotein n=1 Tax=unclassified Candidatus Frackibacter TaxID=2648818 RepID=UPI00079B0DB1|nr:MULTISPECIES: BMP family ABC transporter substrate-binding protein [unclassified Candidatus Frackibacter]KXS40839.1 MAG: putative ABC-type transport system, periplasmic component/surface lipoprotein [Candidatus Frackibacter sp. T328-2]SDB97974.1 nucleoside-binding protein [Candidatus Frackibacter sp. WG11]SEM29679.1 nucleoside-binding protein [Candidatus Frackibacter sp. WG12]SFL34586.1 nucleoside-binding protein [Candidatus Frackibacter sp. WG13]
MLKFNRKTVVLVAILLVGLLVAGCGGGNNQDQQGTQEDQKESLKVGIVLSSGGKGDKSFNDSAIRGLERAKEDFDIEYKYIEPKQVSAAEKGLRFLAQNGYDLVIGVGFMQQDAVDKVSKEFPDTKFALIDSVVERDNVVSLTFKEHQGSFLAGALSALLTTHDEVKGINEEKVVGFLGGMNMPLIHKFELGYTSGVDYINEQEGINVKVKVAYAGTSPDAFNNPAKGKEIALSQYNAGADIIYHASGGTGGGLFKAAAKQGKYAIGVDSDQDWVQPGFVLTSMLKRVDNAVYQTVKAVKNDNFESGVQEFGLKENGVGLTPLTGVGPTVKTAKELGDITAEDVQTIKEMKNRIPEEVKQKVKDIKEKIIAGEIKVPNYLEQQGE